MGRAIVGHVVWSAPEAVFRRPGIATLGIRPEDITLADEKTSGDRFRGKVRVGAVELVGAESYAHGTLADGEPLIFRLPGARAWP